MKSLVAKMILILWKDYMKSKAGREADVPVGLPVFNATNFMYWLQNKYRNK